MKPNLGCINTLVISLTLGTLGRGLVARLELRFSQIENEDYLYICIFVHGRRGANCNDIRHKYCQQFQVIDMNDV